MTKNIPPIPDQDLKAYNTWVQDVLDRMFKAESNDELRSIVWQMCDQHPEWIEAFKHDYNHTIKFFS